VSQPSQTRALSVALIGVPLLFVSLAALQTRIDALKRNQSQREEVLLLSSPAAVKKLSLGYESLFADIYWTRVVQYYGERIVNGGGQYDLLWPLLDITTTLDPKLVVAYRFGAIFLSQPRAPARTNLVGGAGRPDLAIELVKRGIAANPGRWVLYSDLGFLYYWQMKDYKNAAAAYLAGSAKPKAPQWMKMMAARVAAKGGSLENSSLIWSEVYASTRNPAIQKTAWEMLRSLQAQEDEMRLDALAAAYQKRFGRFPTSTNELLQAGYLTKIPVDPADHPYIFGPGGKSRLAPDSPVIIPPER
jgi:hypothetical protein